MIPWLIIVVAASALLLLMTRRNLTYRSPSAGLYMIATVAVGGLVGWYLDAKMSWSTLASWGLAAEGIAAAGTVTLLIGVVVGVAGMLSSAFKSGEFVS